LHTVTTKGYSNQNCAIGDTQPQIVKVRASLSEEYEISDDDEEDKELTWIADDEEFAQISDVEIDEEIFKESNSFQSQHSSSRRQIKHKVFDSDSLFYE
jgi:hypothetical protein